MSLRIVVPPTAEPFDLDSVKKHIEYEYDDRDPQIEEKAITAREDCEGEQNRCYITQTLEYTMDAWPARPVIYLPRAPVQAVESIIYTDYLNADHVYHALALIALTLTAGVNEGNDGNVTITLNGVEHTVAVTKGTAAQVAAQIRAVSYSGWRTGGTGAVVTFTATTAGDKGTPAYDPGATGATGSIAATREGVDGSLIIDTASEPARICLGYGQSWPSATLAPISAIKIRFKAGYGDSASAVPRRFIQAIYMLTAHYWENREAVAARGHIPQVIPMGVARLLRRNIVHWSVERNASR